MIPRFSPPGLECSPSKIATPESIPGVLFFLCVLFFSFLRKIVIPSPFPQFIFPRAPSPEFYSYSPFNNISVFLYKSNGLEILLFHLPKQMLKLLDFYSDKNAINFIAHWMYKIMQFSDIQRQNSYFFIPCNFKSDQWL